jgi:hypothetical protein
MSSRSSNRAASGPAKARPPVQPVEPPEEPAEPSVLSLPAPYWSRWVLVALGALFLISCFTNESGDSDTWWHLKTGQYIVQNHRLPVPDPFSWTSYMGQPAYPGEETTRYFNLTHEWLSQVMLYAAFAARSFTGLILLKALILTMFCGLGGLIVYRRTGSYHRAIGAAFAIVMVLRLFVVDRPQMFTYLFLALTILILEGRRHLWLLPPLLLVWANCHAGFIMGWVAMGAYCGEALYYRSQGKPIEGERRLWIMCLAAIAVSGLNPNVFNVIPVLGYYRQSKLQASIWEWQRPKYWEVSPFTIVLYASAAFLALNYKRSRPSEWILLVLFGISGLMAMRNIVLIGLWGSILIATYLPKPEEGSRAVWGWAAALGLAGVSAYFLSFLFGLFVLAAIAAVVVLLVLKRWPMAAEGLIAILLLGGIMFQINHGLGFQFRGADWKYPVDAADFILKHHLKGRMYNNYTQGGYLLWRLWPEQKVFVDGRALNEGVNGDATRISMNADTTNGKSGEQLLKDYGIDIIVMDAFDPMSGMAYYLPAALADPSQKEWKLVYQDIHDVIYMRNPPPDVPVLPSLDALSAMERQCAFYVEHGQPMCSRGMADVFGRIGDRERYEGWKKVAAQYRGAEGFTVVRK